MKATSSRLKKRGTIQLIRRTQFKSHRHWWYRGALEAVEQAAQHLETSMLKDMLPDRNPFQGKTCEEQIAYLNTISGYMTGHRKRLCWVTIILLYWTLGWWFLMEWSIGNLCYVFFYYWLVNVWVWHKVMSPDPSLADAPFTSTLTLQLIYSPIYLLT